MTRPKPKPFILKKLLYYKSALSLITFLVNWPVVVLGYLGISDFSKGVTVKLKNGLRFRVKHYLDVWGIKEVIGDNDYDLRVSDKVKFVVDIGGNIGSFSTQAALKFPNAQILVFEPSKSTYKLLTHNLRMNGLDQSVTAYNLAVFSKKTSLKLYNPGPSGMRSIYNARGEDKYEIVKTTTLRDIVSKSKARNIDILKIDCEGAEYDLLRSCPKEVFSKIKNIRMEFHELNSKQDHHELVNILQENGFKTIDNYHPIENTIGYIYASK